MTFLKLVTIGFFMPLFAFARFAGHGDLLLVRYVPGDKKAKIFVGGNKLADLDFNKDANYYQ